MVVAELFAALGLRVDQSAFRRGQEGIDRLHAGLRRLAVAAVAYEGVRWFAGQIRDTVEAGSRVNDLAQSAGVTTDTLQALGYAAKLNSSDMESMGSALGKLSRNMLAAKNGGEEQTKAFAAMGVRVTDTTGHLRPVEDVLGDVADHFQAMPDGAEKTAQAMSVLGRAGAGLIPMLNEGSAGLEAWSQEARDLGVVLDKDTISSLDDFGDTVDRAKFGLTGLRNQAVVALLPPLKRLTEGFIAWVKANRVAVVEKLRGAAEALGRAFTWLAGIVSRAVDVAQQMIETLERALPGIDVFRTAMVAAGIAIAAAWIAALGPVGLIAVALVALTLIVQDLYTSIKYGDGVFADLWRTIETGYPKLGATAAAVVALVSAFKDAVGWIQKAIDKVDSLVDKAMGIKDFAQTVRDLVPGMGSGKNKILGPVGVGMDLYDKATGGTTTTSDSRGDMTNEKLAAMSHAEQMFWASQHPDVTGMTGHSLYEDVVGGQGFFAPGQPGATHVDATSTISIANVTISGVADDATNLTERLRAGMSEVLDEHVRNIQGAVQGGKR